ncbi:hypothetical protein [Petrimonas sulfuriphila]|uniref:hypothetical protein n=1 Tax=Petrimonas sulfuriphila TaxID=285070 RepID=UPI003EB72BD2
MKNRILLKEIPSGKFHSAIFTTYSINLYYLEQQVLSLLGSKGIHYVSVLVDSNMLNTQLDAYSILSEHRKRNYAVHGIQCNGSFHPKIIFLAGETTLLLLLGSGNLTSSGHGKNLEVWNAIYIDNDKDKKLGIVIQAWNYLKNLHADLGLSAQYKIKSIEENCALLSNTEQVKLFDWYEIDDNSKISFLANGSDSLFSQLSNLIDNSAIESITTMSPFYDSEGKLIHQLNKRFNPKKINIILQEDFGAVPTKMKPASNMTFFNWLDIQNENVRQDYFHAKNFVFKGKSKSYLLSGSANASLAAFGSESFAMTNHEVCILYQSNNIDFLKTLGINLNGDKTNLSDIATTTGAANQERENQSTAFIKAVEKSYDNVVFYFTSKKELSEISLRLFDTKGNILFEEIIEFRKGETSFQLTTPQVLPIFYCELFNKGKSISNKQFVIDINAFESTNPSPKNRSLNKIRKLIESGSFSSPKIIEYLNTIYKQRATKKIATASSKSDEERKDEFVTEEESDLLYLSYEEIQKRVKLFDEIKKGKGYIEYKCVRLWDSIFSYLKESKEKEEQSKIDEEETEDVNKSSGRVVENDKKPKKEISKSTNERLKEKVEKFLLSYWDILESKIDSPKAEKPTLIDLSMFLIILEILLHLLNHKEKVEGQEKEEHLLRIRFSKNHPSWSEFTLHFIGMFLLWCSQKQGFKEIESSEYDYKLSLYKEMAYKTTISALSLFTAVNRGYEINKVTVWKQLGLLNAKLCFNNDKISYKDINDFLLFIPQDTREEFGDSYLQEELNESLSIVNRNKLDKEFYLHPEDGITFIEKVISNANDNSKIYLKLFSTGYEWDDEIDDYWNGKVFSIKESRWLSSRKE